MFCIFLSSTTIYDDMEALVECSVGKKKAHLWATTVPSSLMFVHCTCFAFGRIAVHSFSREISAVDMLNQTS
jgi:hypothetical protein